MYKLLRVIPLTLFLFASPPRPEEDTSVFERFLAELEDFRVYFAENNLEAVIDSSNSGLFWYHIERSREQPASSRSVATVHYKGFLFPDSVQFVNTYLSGEALDFIVDVDAVLPCINEAVQYVGEGGRIFIFSPSVLAYGETGFPGVVPENTPVMFEIELIDVSGVQQ
jgi:FKBP-type peptidyl-prolyl cis-trans isomerase FkpA/FKBP-type peptidyl-prolyl cis-trans isomerase FklB